MKERIGSKEKEERGRALLSGMGLDHEVIARQASKPLGELCNSCGWFGNHRNDCAENSGGADGKPRGARFDVLDQHDPKNLDADYIVIDIRAAQLPEIIEHLQLCATIAATREATSEPDTTLYGLALLVKASHPKNYGKTKADGSPPDVSWPPSLLSEKIPKE